MEIPIQWPALYTANLLTSNGCDSVVTLNLTVSPAITSTINEAICQGQTFAFNGTTYSTAGSYTGNFRQHGAVCDSIVTLNLTVNPTVTTALNQSICTGQSYSFNGNTYTTAGTYTANLLTSNGCDSVVTLNLTVAPAITSTINEAICQGQIFAFNGTTYSTAGSYTGTFGSTGGCDSIVTLILTVNPTVTTALNQSICTGQSFSFNGNTYTTAGTYTANLLTSNGCDSVVTLNLTVDPAITNTLNEAICQGQTFAFNGATYSTVGSYTGTFSSAGGCDSIVTLNLTVKPTVTTALNQSICTGQSFAFNGNTYTTAGTYTANLLTSNGCDSVVTLNLTVDPAITNTLNEAICQGQTFAFNGTTYSTAGSYTGTFSSAGGCDSIVTLILTVNPTATTTLNQSICTGQSYSFNGNTYTTAGTYTANLLTSNGCDSVVTLNLTIDPAITNTLNEAICQGQTFAFNGTTYSTAGSYTGTFSSTGGCDSIVTLNLTVNPTVTTSMNQSICTGQSFAFNGNTYTTAGTYTANLLTSNGCDSVVTLNLTVDPAITNTLNEAICQGQTFAFNGTTYSTAGTYTGTFSSTGGCDSIVTLILTVNPTATTTLNQSICTGQSFCLQWKYLHNGRNLHGQSAYQQWLRFCGDFKFNGVSRNYFYSKRSHLSGTNFCFQRNYLFYRWQLHWHFQQRGRLR